MREDPTDTGALIQFGLVDSVDLGERTCVVAIGEILTAGIAWLEHRVGAMKIWCPPAVGEQVALLCPDGDIAGAVVIGALPSDANPAAGDSSTVVIEMADGSRITFDPEAHALDAVLAGDGKVRVEAKSITLIADQVHIEGELQVTGDASFDAGIHAAGQIASDDDVKAGGISLKAHIHDKTQPGSGVSGAPK